MPTNPVARYTNIAIALHWAMALAFFLMIGSGLSFDWITDKALKFQLYQWHKSLGLILLALFFMRVIWRLTHYPPALPDGISRLDLIGAKLGHLALYAFMLLIPLSGWIMVSSSPYGLPTFIFGLFEWPHIPGMAANESINHLAKDAHEIMAYLFAGTIILHIAAVIKHAIHDKINLLPRMGIKCTKTKD